MYSAVNKAKFILENYISMHAFVVNKIQKKRHFGGSKRNGFSFT